MKPKTPVRIADARSGRERTHRFPHWFFFSSLDVLTLAIVHHLLLLLLRPPPFFRIGQMTPTSRRPHPSGSNTFYARPHRPHSLTHISYQYHATAPSSIQRRRQGRRRSQKDYDATKDRPYPSHYVCKVGFGVGVGGFVPTRSADGDVQPPVGFPEQCEPPRPTPVMTSGGGLIL